MKKLRNENGYTLILTLVITVLVIMFSTAFAANALNQNKLVENTDDTYEVTAVAEMGVEYYKAKILNKFSEAFKEAKAKKDSINTNSALTKQEKDALISQEVTNIYNSLKSNILAINSGKATLDSTHEYDLTEIKFDTTNPNKLLYTVAGKNEAKEKSIEAHITFPSLENLIAHNSLQEYLLVLSNDPTYLAKKAAYEAKLSKYNADLTAYQQYLIDKAKYDADLVKYNADLANYNNATKNIKIPEPTISNKCTQGNATTLTSDCLYENAVNFPNYGDKNINGINAYMKDNFTLKRTSDSGKTNLDNSNLYITGDAYFDDLTGNTSGNHIFIKGDATFNDTGGGFQNSVVLIAGDVTFTGKATAGIKDSSTFCVAGDIKYDPSLKPNDIKKLSPPLILKWGPDLNEDQCGSYTNTVNPPVPPIKPTEPSKEPDPGPAPQPETVTIPGGQKELEDVLLDNVIYK